MVADTLSVTIIVVYEVSDTFVSWIPLNHCSIERNQLGGRPQLLNKLDVDEVELVLTVPNTYSSVKTVNETVNAPVNTSTQSEGQVF